LALSRPGKIEEIPHWQILGGLTRSRDLVSHWA
jgi:hypothetical protein